VRILAFSDLHRDQRRARSVVQRAAHADVVAAVGDLASMHRGLDDMIEALHTINRPVLLVPGNNETDDALRDACADWPSATVLHGEAAVVEGVTFFGLGGGIPETPWEWSFDLSEEHAERRLTALPVGAVLLVHSPPKGHVDRGHGSAAVLRAIEDKQPRLVLCGHIHECWGQESRVGDVPVRNLGPDAATIEVNG
jgi:Icc-related predicted phosphoesterase